MNDTDHINSVTHDAESTGLDAEEPRASIIQLSFDPESGCVTAHLLPSPDAPTASMEGVRRQLDDEGYGDFLVSESILQPLVLRANRAESGDYVVAERRDAELDWDVSNDKQAVYLTAIRAYGGKGFTRQTLIEGLKERRVPDVCIDREVLNKVAAEGQADYACLAQAIPAEPGEDARFEVLVDVSNSLHLDEDDQGVVDFRELHDFLVVEPDTPLVRRHPPTKGKPGLDVAGQEIAPKPGKDKRLKANADGVKLSEGDSNLLVSAIKGHPVVVPQGVRVDPTLKVKNVDLTTGNIDFDGSVEVAGDVTSGFVVRATGDIYIRGMVDKAEIHAGKNLVVAGGIIGEDAARGNDKEPVLRTEVKAGGTINAKFANLVKLYAGGDMQLREYVMQSYLDSGGAISLGQKGGRGALIGGKLVAARLLKANIIGSEANVYTEVRIGTSNPKRRLMEALKNAVVVCEHNCDKLTPVLETLERKGDAAPQDKLAKVRNMLSAQRDRQQRLLDLIQRLTARRKLTRGAAVIIKKQLHANVNVTVDSASNTFTRDMGPRHLVRRGTEVVNKI